MCVINSTLFSTHIFLHELNCWGASWCFFFCVLDVGIIDSATYRNKTERTEKVKSIVNTYLEYSKAMKPAGTFSYEKTICSYILDFKWKCNLKKITTNDLSSFLKHLKITSDLSNVSINKTIKMLKYIARFNNFDIPDLMNYKLLREKQSHFDKISYKNIQLILTYIEKMECRGNGSQYRMMILLLFDTGIRQAELLNIKISDIDLDNKCILIKARKSCKDRYVFLSSEINKRLSKYKPVSNNQSLLFYNELRNREFNRNDMKSFYRRIKKATGIEKLHSHMFRHTYATDLIELEVPLFVVQQQLGHASIKTTEIYYHSSLKYQKEAMDKISDIR